MSQDLDLVPTDELFASLVRRWPDCMVIGQKINVEGHCVQYRRRAGNPFTLLGLLMIELQVAQRDILDDARDVGGDDI